MLDIETLKKYDSENMHETYDIWHKIAKEAYNSPQKQVNFSNIKHIVFAGMGGSGTVGDIFAAILSKKNIHVTVVKGYLLPETVNSDTVVITTSVSGNTKETLSILKSAKNMKCKIIGFSSGGKMEEYCNKYEIEYRKIEKNHSPRSSLTSYVYSILKVLQKSLKIKESDILESITELEILNDKINSSNLTKENPALQLSNWIKGIPVVYYPFGLQSVAIRFKNSFQENSKMHIFTEDIIEVCHNGIVAWEKDSDVQPILLQGQDDYIKTKERQKIIEKFFDENSIKYYKISSIEGNILSKLITLIYLLDYATIYHAVSSKLDPSPVSSIDFIKKEIENNS